MKLYIGAKLIRAEEMSKDGQPGYKVVYEDGYTSWSPKEVFERAYREVEVPAEVSDKLELRITRYKEKADDLFGDGCTISKGKLYKGDTLLYSCYFCEPAGPDTTEANKDRRIPEGRYNTRWEPSTLAGASIKGKLPLLYNDKVPASRMIRIHVGNKGTDSLGCLLPGQQDAGWGVGKSKAALIDLLDHLWEKNFDIIIKNEITRSE